MSKFNNKNEGISTKNLANGNAYKESPKLELISLLLTSFVNDTFYESKEFNLARLRDLIDVNDKEFVAKAAIYARNEFGMRSITHVVAAEIANKVRGVNWTKGFFDKVTRRVDDMTEIVSYYFNNYDKKLPMALKKGLSRAFNKFSDYHISKYMAKNKEVKLIDLVNLTHPIPTDKNKKSLNFLVKGSLKNEDTWETKLTQAGQKAENQEEKNENKKEAWKQLLNENKLGYFALLKNIRNIVYQAPECIDILCKQLINEKAIKNSLIMPVRFIVAYNQLVNIDGIRSRDVIDALNTAVEISLSNTPKFEGKTLIVLDTSGSMGGQPATIGSLFASTLYKTNDSDFITFSDESNYQVLNHKDSLFTIADSINFVCGGTNFHSIFEKADKAYERIIILSDMQGWIGSYTPVNSYNKYCEKYNCRPYIYSFDLSGYGTTQFPENNIFCIAGFSDKVFDLMSILEQDKNILIKTIEEIKL